MKLYHSPFSANARKVRLASRLLNLPMEEVVVDLMTGQQRQPDYIKLNPNGRVPTLVDGDFVLWESNAIMQYICDAKGGGHALYPVGAKSRADINRWLFWAATHWAPNVATVNFEKQLKGMFKIGTPEPALIKTAEDNLRQFGKVLDGHLATHKYVSDDTLTIADLAIAAPLMYAKALQLPLEELSNLQRWQQSIMSLDAWKQTEMPAMQRPS